MHPHTATSSSSKAAALIADFAALGGKEARRPADVTGDPILYCVVNGENILALGEGRRTRLTGLMRGSSCLKHTKAFIVSASNRLHGANHRYFWMPVPEKDERKKLESELKRVYGDVWIPDANISRTVEAAPYLWKRLKEEFAELCPAELDLAMELVTRDGDILYAAYRVPRMKAFLNRIVDGYFR